MAKKKSVKKKSATKRKQPTALKKVNAEAKKIRKASPRTSWPSALKQAGKKLRKK